jgi:lysophospholipase L1-like esterase
LLSSESGLLGRAFLSLGGLNVALAALLNRHTLAFLYADGRLVRDAVSNILTVQAGFLALGLALAAAGALLLRYRGKGLGSTACNAILAAASFLYVPLVAELLLSLGWPGVYGRWDPFGLCRTSVAIDDRRLGHVLNPALDHSYRINRRGLRGPELEDPKPRDEVRLLTLGDSITFGWELSEDEATWPGQLQALLDRRARPGRRYRVVNAAVPRYTSEQVLRLLRDRLDELQPDLAVLCVGWNDLAFSYEPDWYPRISFTGHSTARYCRSFSPAILRAIRHWKGQDDGDPRPRRRRSPHPAALAEYEDNLVQIVAALRERGVPLLLLNLPSVLSRGPMTERESELASRFPEVDNLAAFDGVVREVCRRTGVPCRLDVFALDQTGKGAYFYDHCHLNREGNAVMARMVLEALTGDASLREPLG